MPNVPEILVVGSVNMDLVVRAPHMPAPGETVLGRGFATCPGGKGANQAVAAIVVAGGANARLTPDDVFTRAALFASADVVLLQLELPLPTVRAAKDLAQRHACKVVLDPAPVPASLGPELCEVDVLTPNVIEAERITGHRAGEDRAERNTALDLLALGAKAVALKLGARGSLVATSNGQLARLRAYKVDIVDTTAAGDAFTAALGVAIGRGQELASAARFANAAGALACTRLGAQQAMPTLDEVRMLIADQPA